MASAVDPDDVDSDDPLTDAELLFGDVRADEDVVDEVRTWLPSEGEVAEQPVYNGRLVRWIGTEGRMLYLPWDRVHSYADNPFVPDKVAAFAEIIRAGGRPALYAPPVRLTRVSLVDVEQTQREARERSQDLMATHGMTRPYTTGDEELDEFLADRDDFVDTYAEEGEEDELRREMDSRAKVAEAESTGDLGKTVAYFRDGNHRAMAAQLAGEDGLWVIVRWDNESELEFAGLSRSELE